MRPSKFLILLIGICYQARSQNLVPNGSFEFFKKCPGNYSQAPAEFRVDEWYSATAGTPDHFNACSHGESDVPHNWAGVSDPFDGTGYVGIYMWMDNLRSYREYLQCKLSEPLIKDSLYHVEFHFKWASYSRYSIDRMGMHLSDTAIRAKHDRVLNLEPTFPIVHDTAFSQQTGVWEEGKFVYRARGGEQFVTIGNFWDDQTTKSFNIPFRPMQQLMLNQSAYYYIDDVKIIPDWVRAQELLAQQIPDFSIPDAQLNTNYVLKNIQFQFNSYRLIPPSFFELDRVAEYLIKHPDFRVQLFGHTDDRGTAQYNLKLSQARAKNVAEYLTTVGVKPDRIDYFGYGKAKPLVSDTSEEARTINRRVEIRFVLP